MTSKWIPGEKTQIGDKGTAFPVGNSVHLNPQILPRIFLFKTSIKKRLHKNNGISVQGEIENALKVLFKVNCNLQAAGRTDAGVHALGQVAHVDLPLNNDFSKKNNFYLVSALNSLLRKYSIRIVSTQNTSFDTSL